MWGLTWIAFASAAQIKPQQTGERTYCSIRHIPAKSNILAVESKQSVIADRDPVGVAAEVS
jgi:hypothetical protein